MTIGDAVVFDCRKVQANPAKTFINSKQSDTEAKKEIPYWCLFFLSQIFGFNLRNP